MSPILLFIGAARAGSVHVDQARIFLHRHYYADAMTEVEAGLADPAIADALDLYAIGVDAAWELGDIDRVLTWSQQAADLALGGDVHDAWQARHDTVAASWGWVRVSGPRGFATTPLQVEPAAPILDPEQKRISRVIALRVHDPTALPARIPLPAGGWRVNGEAITVEPGATVGLTLLPGELGLAGLAALQTLRVEVAVGTQLLLGERVAHLSPTGVLQLDLTGPVGPLLLGGGIGWAPQPYGTALGHRYASPFAGSAVVHLGGDLPIAGALAVRPALGVQGALLQGIGISCGCGDAIAPGTALYVPAWTAGPVAALGVEWRQAGRSSATAIGVRVEGAMLMGATVTGGTATVDGVELPWTSGGQRLTAGSVRIGAYLGL